MIVTDAGSKSYLSRFYVDNDHTYCEKKILDNQSKQCCSDLILSSDWDWDALGLENFDDMDVNDYDGYPFGDFHYDLFGLDEYENIRLDDISSCSEDTIDNALELSSMVTDLDWAGMNQDMRSRKSSGNINDLKSWESLDLFELVDDVDISLHSIEPTFSPLDITAVEMYTNIFAQTETNDKHNATSLSPFAKATNFEYEDSDIQSFSVSDELDCFYENDTTIKTDESFERNSFSFESSEMEDCFLENFTFLEGCTAFDTLLMPSSNCSSVKNPNGQNTQNVTSLFHGSLRCAANTLENPFSYDGNIYSSESDCNKEDLTSAQALNKDQLYNTSQIAFHDISGNLNHSDFENNPVFITEKQLNQPDNILEHAIRSNPYDAPIHSQNSFMDSTHPVTHMSVCPTSMRRFGDQYTAKLEQIHGDVEGKGQELTSWACHNREEMMELEETMWMNDEHYSTNTSVSDENLFNEYLQDSVTRHSVENSEIMVEHDFNQLPSDLELNPYHSVPEWELHTMQHGDGTVYTNLVNDIRAKLPNRQLAVPLNSSMDAREIEFEKLSDPFSLYDMTCPSSNNNSGSTLSIQCFNDSNDGTLFEDSSTLERLPIGEGNGNSKHCLLWEDNFEAQAKIHSSGHFETEFTKTIEPQSFALNGETVRSQIPERQVHADRSVTSNFVTHKITSGNTNKPCTEKRTTLHSGFHSTPIISYNCVESSLAPEKTFDNISGNIGVQTLDNTNAYDNSHQNLGDDIYKDKSSSNNKIQIHYAISNNSSCRASSGDDSLKNSSLENRINEDLTCPLILNNVENIPKKDICARVDPMEKGRKAAGEKNNKKIVAKDRFADVIRTDVLSKMGLSKKTRRNMPRKSSSLKDPLVIMKNVQSHLKKYDDCQQPKVSVGADGKRVYMQVNKLMYKNVRELRKSLKIDSQKTSEEIEHECQENTYLVRRNKTERLKTERQRLISCGLGNKH